MKKIVIAELSDVYYWDKFFPFYNNIWGLQLNNDYTGISNIDFKLEDIGFKSTLDIGSIRVEQIVYTRLNTIDELIADESTGTFYYNDTTKRLLIKFVAFKPPAYFEKSEIVIGLIIGFYNSPAKFNGIVNNRQYKPDLLNSPLYTKKLDNIYNQKQVFESGVVNIDNTSRDYSGFSIGYNTKNRAGSFLKTLFWTGENEDSFDYSKAIVSYQGAVTKIQEGKTMSFNLKDIRSTLNKRTTFNTIDNSLYPYLSDSDRKIFIPQIWGRCKRVPCICLNTKVNEGLTSNCTDYEFLFLDTLKPSLK